jgi:glutamate/tyrosine decarboxylase-like PLP-dependent enzyme
MNLEDLGDKDLQEIHQRYRAIAEKAQDALEEEDLEAAAEHIEKLATAKRQEAKNGGSARRKPRAEHNRKRS